MESLRRPSVLAALAAAVLALGLVVLVARGASDSGDEDLAADAGTEDTTTDPGQGDPDATGDADGATDADSGQAAQDGSDDGAAAGEQDGGASGDDGAAAEDGAGADDADGAAFGAPPAGEYGYASSGTWSLSGGEQPEEHQLPGTATATVQVDGDAWQVRLAAGEDYADRFGFAPAADGGLDWTSWVLERQFGNDPRNETSYSCSGDAAYYLPGEQGRMVGHQCESEAGLTSDGQVEHLGTEEVTLGDGTVVAADRLLYTYTVTGSGAEFEVTGEGRLDLWLDPATGLRLREQRSISTTTAFATGQEQVYQEDVEFTLQSQPPS